ncbi:uncharacterized protein LOC123676520 [Harmonia axyridis]|uniref:uncharacterized protein LOC123676520 n=1 Tax=Harmonia axyridis TaxID=115357 RepID=UPI001E2791E0|nr:uncharacterized protein LOC123676520 [Harmonia axyridis]
MLGKLICNVYFVKLYYLFLNYILPKISNLNQNFQSDKVVLPYLHKMMEEAYRNFLLCYMERQYVTKTAISEIDPSNKTWFLPKKNVDKEKKIDINEDIDIFWGKLQKYTNEMGVFEFQNLSQFVLNILSLPHSNAECERVFSKINLVKTKSRNKLITNTINGCLLTSQCVKKDGNCVDFTPTQNISSIEVDEDEFVIDG